MRHSKVAHVGPIHRYKYVWRFRMDYTSLISGLTGTLLGGTITWLNTRYSLNIQFREQEKRADLMVIKTEYIALNSVDKELAYNLIHLRIIEQLMNNQKLNHLDLKETQQHLHFRTEKWDKHSDIIETLNLSKDTTNFLPALQSFYINIKLGVINERLRLKTIEELIKLGLTAKVFLENYLNIHKKKL